MIGGAVEEELDASSMMAEEAALVNEAAAAAATSSERRSVAWALGSEDVVEQPPALKALSALSPLNGKKWEERSA